MMNAQTQSLGAGLFGDALVRSQIEALASGELDTATFLRVTIARLRKDPDENWEVLSLLDQAFRLGKIKEEAFKSVKNGLAEFVLRPRSHDAASAAQPATPVTPPQPVAPPPVATQAVAAQPVAAPSVTPPPPVAVPVTHDPVFPSTPLTFSGNHAVTQPTGPQARMTPPQRMSPRVGIAAGPGPASPSRSSPAARTEVAPAPPAAARAEAPAPIRPAAREDLPTATAPQERDIAPGDVLRARYRIVNFIGQGGRGLVYEATDPYRLESQAFGQRIAIKVMRRSLAQRAESVLELRREFQLLQSLSHPNIVRVHEFDRDGALSFFTMELLNGVLLTRLAQAHQNRPMTRGDALSILRDVGAAVSFAHSRHVVHGDLNPQNIFITFDGEVRVLDFGAARKTTQLSVAPGEEVVQGSFATAGYASTQVMQGEAPTVEDDVFSLGCIAYLLLAGRHPFGGVSALEAQAARQRPRRPRGMKDGTWRALKQALQYERRKRPGNLADWLSRFDLGQASAHLPSVNELLEEHGGTSRGAPWGALAAVLLVALAAGYYSLVQQEILPAPAFLAALKGDRSPQGSVELRAPSPDEPPLGAAESRVTPAHQAASGGSIRTPAAAGDAPRDSEAARIASTPARTGVAPIAAPARSLPEVPAVAVNAASPAPRAASVPGRRSDLPAAPPPGAVGVNVAGATAAVMPRASLSRIELAADTVEVGPQDSAARIVVHRRGGSARGDAPFRWWTESGTAKPVADFQVVAPRVEQIPDGAASVVLSVPVSQIPRAQPRSFYVVIDQTEAGATVSGRTLTMVTLAAPE